MVRCRHCLNRMDSDTIQCPVCGIDKTTPKKDLSTEEKRVRRAARGIRISAMLHLVIAALTLIALPYALSHRTALIILAVINLALAAGLIRFSLSAYRLAVTCYFGIGMVNIITVNLPGLPLILVLLYLVGNRYAKALFERRLPLNT
ncbi:MAG: hypothetical protein JXR25_11575 [Pontiellaceae bacterium]|nr:hypothetical protein [Pontiellaceae bacterium]MBN2785454.1 hypothetical protein [Pontiellaceae bacterium]